MKALTIFLGIIVLLCGLGIVFLIYHLYSQEMWRDIINEEYEAKYEDEIESRWRSQRIRVHYGVRIVDEMNRKEQCNEFESSYYS